MATKKVIAYYMHEHEQAAIGQRIQDAALTPSYWLGSMDEEDIEELEDQGVVVEVIEEAPEEEEGDTAPAPPPRPGLGAAAGRAPLPGPPRDAALHPLKDNVYLITLSSPFLLEDWRQELAEHGCRLIEHLPSGAFTAYLSLAQVEAVKQLSFVSDVRLFAPTDSAGETFTAMATRTTGGLPGIAPHRVPFDVLLHRPEDLDDVVTWLQDHQVRILAQGRRKIRVELAEGSDTARDIEALPEVRQVTEYVEPKLSNEVARRLLGLDANPDPAPVPDWPHTGDDEIVAVADSGLDDAHPDFSGRVVQLVARGRPGDTSDPQGHGTHVAGSVLGNGAASGGTHRGTAPGAKLFFQSIMDSQGGLGGLPIDLQDLFDEAYQAGARVHNNSWSADTRSFYTFNALEVDEYVASHPDLLVVIAAGNEASAKDPFNAAPGFVDWLSIGSPATAKNALTVGASRTERNSGGQSGLTYRDFDPNRFADPPIAGEHVSGNPECLAAFSARGPCDPRRLKPDLVAPGTDILSTRASTAPAGNFWGLLTDNERYAFMGGTSMAAPLISGCAALIREYYRTERNHEASAALVKATLINSTRRLTGQDAVADHAGLPNYHQGFGAPHMPFAYPNPREPWLKLELIDTWKDEPRRFAGTGDRVRLAFEVAGGPFLRLCLAWTDPAAGADLQNSLGMILEHGALDPSKVMGNQDRPSPVGPVDRDNNVQIIRIENPPAGSYLVQIFAPHLLHPPQDWALVVTGDLDGGLVEI